MRRKNKVWIVSWGVNDVDYVFNKKPSKQVIRLLLIKDGIIGGDEDMADESLMTCYIDDCYFVCTMEVLDPANTLRELRSDASIKKTIMKRASRIKQAAISRETEN